MLPVASFVAGTPEVMAKDGVVDKVMNYYWHPVV